MEELLDQILNECRPYTKQGAVATYIPELSKQNVTTHNSCQNVHIIKNRPGKPGLPGFMPRYTGTAKRTTHVNATRKNAAFLGSTLHFGPMA